MINSGDRLMNGITIRAKAPPAVGAIFVLTIAIGLLGTAAVTQNVHFAIGAIMPVLCGLALWRTRPGPFTLKFGLEGLEVGDPIQRTIPYDNLQGLRALSAERQKTVRQFPITIIDREGSVTIPKHIDVPSADVYRFLYQLFPETGSRDVNPILSEHLQQQEQMFGSDKVFAYRARDRFGPNKDTRSARAFCLAGMLSCVVWALIGFASGKQTFAPWAAAGLGGGFVMAIAWLHYRIEAGRGGKGVHGWQDASMVISPLGLALIQGPHRGEMRWDELRNVKFVTKTSNNNATIGFLLFGVIGYAIMARQSDKSKRGILLQFAGGHLRIADYYDRPLPIILSRIKQYWGGK